MAVLTKKPHRAHIALEYTRKLCSIEREVKNQGLSFEAIKIYRQEQAKPILDEYKEWLNNQINAVSAGAFKSAIKYTLNQWTALNAYLEQGYLKMDNNDSERRMKPIALGRKNYLFVGSERGGNAAAAYYSLVETCKNFNINPLEYLTDILTRLPDYPITRLPDYKTEDDYVALLPDNWITT